MSALIAKIIYAATLLILVLAGSIVVDAKRRLSKVLRVVGFAVAPLVFYGTGYIKLVDFQVLLTTVAGLTAVAISMHAEGYYRYMYGAFRYYQAVIDTCLALLILLFSSTYLAELLVYWFLLDLLIVLAALTLEYGPENLHVSATYLVMCVAPSDAAVLTMFSLIALRKGVEQALMTPIAVSEPLLGLDPAVSLVITFGFVTKLGQFPLHSWLPRVYGEASTHISAMLSSIVSKLGIYGLLIATRVFALNPVAFYVALFQGIITVAYGSLAAVIQSNVKRLLAYSSMAYGGVIVALFAYYSIWPNELLYYVLLLVVVFHVIVKALAFVNVAYVYQIANTYDVYQLGYLYYVSREMSFYAFTALLNLLGAPPSIGFLVKTALIASALLVIGTGLQALIILAAFSMFAVFSVAYSAKFINVYISKIPRVAPRPLPIPAEILYSEAFLSIITVLTPAPFIVYLLLIGPPYTAVSISMMIMYTILLPTYMYILKKEVFTRRPFREDIKYWLSGVEM
ncbi:MAG: proton-conducting transporter membrane subunit [Desulfurococcaceae archaeon]